MAAWALSLSLCPHGRSRYRSGFLGVLPCGSMWFLSTDVNSRGSQHNHDLGRVLQKVSHRIRHELWVNSVLKSPTTSHLSVAVLLPLGFESSRFLLSNTSSLATIILLSALLCAASPSGSQKKQLRQGGLSLRLQLFRLFTPKQ